jgi:hypothetical protein
MRLFTTSRRAVSLAMAAGLVALVLVAIFARLMNYEIKRDEQLYVPPALLLEQNGLYTEFFYNHVPGSAWLFHAVKDILETNHLLLASRLAVFGAWVFFAGSVAWVSYALTRSAVFTLFCVLLILTNDAFLTVTGMTATNNLLPLPFAYLGLGLFIVGVSGDRGRPIAIGAGGLLLGLAATIKASAIGFIPAAALAAFLLPARLSFSSRLRRVVFPLALGGVVGALPVLLYLAADPELFLAHVVGFHTGPHVTYWAAQTGEGADVAMSLAAKAQLAYLVWTGGANAILILGLVLVALLLAEGQTIRSFGRKVLTSPVLLVLATTATVLAMSFVPTPSFSQYFAPVIVCFALLLTLLYSRLDSAQQVRIRPVFLAACVVLVVLNLPRLTQHLGRLPHPESWTPMQVHRHGITLAERLAEAQVEGKIATLAPVYPLEAELPVYPEFATGQFVYRIAQYTDADLARHYTMTSPTEVEELFRDDPPAAILVGFEPELEAPMVRFARENGYLRVEDLGITDRYGKGTLYLRDNPGAREEAGRPPE